MDDSNRTHVNIFVLPSDNVTANNSVPNETNNNNEDVDPQAGYLSHYTSIYYPFAGMIRDIKIRLPYYLSDWKLAFSYRIFAATIRIFFLNTIPALAYVFDLYTRSEGYYGVNEALLGSALGGLK